MDSHDKNEQEWTVVERGPRQRTSAAVNIHGGAIRYETRDMSMTKKRGRFHETKKIVVKDDVDNIKAALHETAWWKGTRKNLLDALEGRTCKFVQCLGLGPISDFSAGFHQFACALLLQELFTDASCTVSDPSMTERDNEIASSCGVHVVKAVPIMRVQLEVGSCGIVFMPHCGRSLNNIIVEQMEERLETSHIVMLGNWLSGYFHDLTSNSAKLYRSKQKKSVEGTLRAMIVDGRFVERICPDPNTSTSFNAFNDLCVTTLTRQRQR